MLVEYPGSMLVGWHACNVIYRGIIKYALEAQSGPRLLRMAGCARPLSYKIVRATLGALMPLILLVGVGGPGVTLRHRYAFARFDA